MGVLLPDQLDDFVNLTLDNFKKRDWIDLSLDQQNYIFAERFLGGKKKVPEKGGVQLNFKVQHSNTGTAKNTEMFAIDEVNIKDLTTEGKVEWSKQTVNFSYDIDEDVFQSDRETIIREIEVREHSMYNDFFILQEDNLWTAPTSATQTPRRPYGIPFWCVKDATTTPSGAFNGGNPAGFSGGAAQISSTTYPNWRNWTYGFSNVTRSEFVKRLRKACEFTKFKAPHNYARLRGEPGISDYEHWTTWNNLEQIEEMLEGRNDNLGADLGVYRGKSVFNGQPILWSSYLQENDSSDPFYSLNWRVFKYFFRKGRHMLRHKPEKAPGQHTVRRVHMDNWGNFCCIDRRCLSVGSTS